MFIFSGNLAELDRSEKFLQSLAELAWFGMNVQKFYMAYQFAGILGLGCVLSSVCVIQVVHTLLSSYLKLLLLLISQKALDTG